MRVGEVPDPLRLLRETRQGLGDPAGEGDPHAGGRQQGREGYGQRDEIVPFDPAEEVVLRHDHPHGPPPGRVRRKRRVHADVDLPFAAKPDPRRLPQRANGLGRRSRLAAEFLEGTHEDGVGTVADVPVDDLQLALAPDLADEHGHVFLLPDGVGHQLARPVDDERLATLPDLEPPDEVRDFLDDDVGGDHADHAALLSADRRCRACGR